MPETISVESGEVTRIAVDRPDAMNALTPQVLDELQAALEDLTPLTRVLVLTGTGEQSFIAGGDISILADFSRSEARAFAEQGHALCAALEDAHCPVIAAINGHAYGAGLELALACDLRIATADAVLGEPEVDLGVIPGFGGSRRLPRIVGDEVARRMIFLGELLDAREALDNGLLSDVVARENFEARIAELTAELAGKPADALQAAKAALDAERDTSSQAGLERERELFADRFETPAQREGMAAFLEDREPEFE